MEKVIAMIERGTDGLFAVYSEELPGVIGSGMTEEEAKKDFFEVKEEQVEYYREKTGKLPDWHSAEIEFRYSLGAFFMAFPYINATQFARNIGINPSLMRKYKMGLAAASDKQKGIIQEQLNLLTEKLQHVQLV